MPRPTLLLLPDPGRSARSWDGVVAALGDAFDVVVLDLPGSGPDAAASAAWVQEAADRVAGRVRDLEPETWLLAGDGAGGTIAATVTAWAEAGERGLTAPAALALVGAPTAAPATEGDAGAPARPRRTPTALLVGAEAGGAGRDHPAVPSATVHEIDGAGRDLLLEQPAEVARLLRSLWSEVRDRPRLPAAFARLIASDRVAARTRRALLARLDEPAPDAPRALSPAQRSLLGAVLARVVPQRGTDLDLAGRIDAQLATGAGDGWRFAELPPDAEAWRRGLDTVAALEPGFAALDAAEQDAAIDRFAAGAAGSDVPALLTGARMALWFQDLQAAAVRTWLSHPAAQAWLRYDGFADGGDGPTKQGFTTTHAGEWEPWQRDWRTGKELEA